MSGAPGDLKTELPPWTVTGERTLLKDRWIHVTAEDCVTASGVEIAPFYLLNYADWAHAAALTPEGRVIMVRQYRHGARAPSLEFAGGVVEPGEALVEAAARELLEETGYAGEVVGVIGSVWANPVSHRSRAHTVLIRNARRVADPTPKPSERLLVEEIAWAGVSASITVGEVIHPLHLSAILQLSLRLGGALPPLNVEAAGS